MLPSINKSEQVNTIQNPDDFDYKFKENIIMFYPWINLFDKIPSQRIFQLVDVRSEDEYNSGHIIGSINIPYELFMIKNHN